MQKVIARNMITMVREINPHFPDTTPTAAPAKAGDEIACPHFSRPKDESRPHRSC